MTNSVEHISELIFTTIKGFGNKVVLFTEEGKQTVDPTEARRFYISNISAMVNFNNDDKMNEIVVNLSKDTDLDSIRPMLSAIRKIASRYLIEYTLKTFGKTISPKDFSHMAKRKVNESAYLAEGTWALPDTEQKIKELADILKSPLVYTSQNEDALFDELGHLIGDDSLFDDISYAQDGEDVRHLVKKRLRALAIEGESWHDTVDQMEDTAEMWHRYFGIPTSVWPYDELHEGNRENKLKKSSYQGRLVLSTGDRSKKISKKKHGITQKDAHRIKTDKGPAGLGRKLNQLGVTKVEENDNTTKVKIISGEWKGHTGKIIGTKNRNGEKFYRIIIDKTHGSDDLIHSSNVVSLNEGFSGWHGSARKSVNELGDAKIILRHKRSVDEAKRGARTHQIESIFIENAEGERFKFPNKNLTAAKAMLKHVNEGGAPHDDFGQHIYGIMEELSQLKRFQRYNRKNDFFESEQDITEEINAHVTNLRKTLGQISGPKGYAHHFESFKKAQESETSAEQINELRDAVTVRYFDERIAESLPYVAKIIEGYKGRKKKEKTIKEFAQAVMKYEGGFALSEALTEDDPESPAMRKFSSVEESVTEWINYLVPVLEDEDLKTKMSAVAESISGVDSNFATLAQHAVDVIAQKANFVESEDDRVADDEEAVDSIMECLDQFDDMRKLFC